VVGRIISAGRFPARGLALPASLRRYRR
jgi:hypothetical protein